ncbi:hypothetical protein ABF86_11050 [Nitrosomonas sp. GH22]|nr:hypothetical protein [Nitrosomonas sp. GH22]
MPSGTTAILSQKIEKTWRKPQKLPDYSDLKLTPALFGGNTKPIAQLQGKSQKAIPREPRIGFVRQPLHVVARFAIESSRVLRRLFG